MVEGKRPDIRLLEPNGLVLNDRIVQPLWSKKRKTAKWRESANNIDRPFYYQSLGADLAGQTGQSAVGFATKMNKSTSPGSITIETNDYAKAFFKKMIEFSEARDIWVINSRNNAIATYGSYLGYMIVLATMDDYIKDVLPLAENNYWSLIGMATILLHQNPRYIPVVEKYLEKAKHLADGQHLKSNEAYVLYIEGLVAKKKGNFRKARNLFRKSIKISSKKDNPAYKTLKEL